MRCKSMQIAADLGHSLAEATNSLSSQLMTKLTGQSSAAAPNDLKKAQLNTNSTSTQTPEPQQLANDTPAATPKPEQTSRELYNTQVHPLQILFLHLACELSLLMTPHAQDSAYTSVSLLR